MTSRTTSTWRAGPWAACTRRLVVGLRGPSCASRTRSSASSFCSRPSSVAGRAPIAMVLVPVWNVVEQLLQFTDVAGHRREQRVPHDRVLIAPPPWQLVRRGHRVPQRRRRMMQPQVDVAVLGERGEDLDAGR